MRFSPDLLDLIRARLPVSQVVARKVVLKRAGREMRGLSPFKQEKTPSFFVNDHKGSWFDFSSGQNGDIFKFLMLTEGLSFPEAVERLAQEAGVALPKASPREAAQADAREEHYRLLDRASRFFAAELAAPTGLAARRYLERRGLTQRGIERFRIGFAPSGRSTLKDHLAAAGFTPAAMLSAGVLVATDAAQPFDRFRNRVMFPIGDLKGRTIAFGGRALDPDAPAKYLNSPETLLFHKGSVLFNAANAREAAHARRQLVVVEGYMDVVTLVEAGFAQTVAPLGTALTAEQLQILWRLVPEPTLCFDGDAAGRQAAFRAVDTVLPHLKPGFSVKFAFLPDGVDPDDLVRLEGPQAFARALERAVALFDVLMQREELRGEATITPEQRASLAARLAATIATIADGSVRAHYEREVRASLWAKDRKALRAIAAVEGRRPSEVAGRRRDNTQPDWRVMARLGERSRLGKPPRAGTPGPSAVRSNALAERALPLPPREALMLRALLNHPWLLEANCEGVAALAFTSAPLAKLRDALLALLAGEGPLEGPELRTRLTRAGHGSVLAMLERTASHRVDRFVEPDAARAEVEAGWRDLLGLQEAQVGGKRALAEVVRAFAADPTEENWRQLTEAHARCARAGPPTG
jgi:DNA primase